MSAGAFGATGGGVTNERLLCDTTPGFWQKFGMSHSPFVGTSGELFSVPQNQEFCSQLQRFRASNNSLMVVPAVLGSGVSTLISKFIDDLDDPARIHAVEAHPKINLETLIKSLSEKFANLKNLSSEFPHLLQQLELLSDEVGSQLLIIDDAHRLSKETMLGLLLLLSQQDLSTTQFRVVLCGDPQLQEQVEGLLSELELAIPRQKISLIPFSLNDTYNYLQHCFKQAGLTGKMPITSIMMKQIHRLSGGYPGRINRVAQQVLIDSYKDEGSFMNFKTEVIAWFQERRVRLLSIGMLIFALCGLWWMQNNGVISNMVEFTRTRIIPQPLATASNTRAIQTRRVAAQDNHPSPTEAAQMLMNAITAAMPTESDEDGEKIAASEMKHLSFLGHHPVKAEAKQPTNIAKAEAKPVIKPEIKTAKVTQPTTATIAPKTATIAKRTTPSVATKLTPQQTAALNDIVDAEGDLLKLEGYTLQIMGTYKPEYVQEYIQKQHLNFDDVAYFKTNNNGKPWFVLVYGQFDNVSDAKAAIAQLPKDLQAQHPWVKPLSDVHSAIRSHG